MGYQAIKVLENIELNKKSLYSRVPGCQITTYYYVGFAYMMMRRYADAIRTFSNILLYVQRTKTMFAVKSYQNDQINKQTDQMYVLLALCITLHPQRIDESLHTTLREKNYAEKMNKMSRGELPEFEACFTFSCPKFLSPVPPNYDAVNFDGDALHKEPLRLQLKVFMDEEQQLMLPTIRSYLKLYTTMPLDKMAGFMEMPPEEFRNHLLAFKHKMKNVVWTKGTSGLEGEFQSGSEVDFYIDKNMIHCRHQSCPQVRRLLHQTDSQVRRAEQGPQKNPALNSHCSVLALVLTIIGGSGVVKCRIFLIRK